MKTKLLKLSEVVLDEKLYPRSHVDWQTSARYYNALKAGAEFPPITVAVLNKKFILVDGAHRLKAFKDCKEKFIKAEVLKNLTPQQIYVESIKRNIANGRQFSAQEITQVAVTLEKWKLSQQAISEIVRIPVAQLKPFIAKRLTRITETQEDIILKAPLQHLAGNDIPSAWGIADIQRGMGGSLSQASILGEVIRLIENDLLDLDNKLVAQKFKKLEKLLNKGA